ncbi:hypothetical protein COU76_01370 [Candidatus Peregrinibacteria bacterium CG10_big_fil_rev_8_21_14_0_10_49_10]|nr:MAG: hypothetical protein COU76_01370 [Candidatus Peregrinibacteria bacterium CG10_big_fil_rev_8_21_14_0_10_49_10]
MERAGPIMVTTVMNTVTQPTLAKIAGCDVGAERTGTLNTRCRKNGHAEHKMWQSEDPAQKPPNHLQQSDGGNRQR